MGLAQGLILGLLLLVAHRPGRCTRLLGFFLLSYTIEILPSFLEDVGLSDKYPAVLWLPLHFYFLSMPLLYLYVRRLTGNLRWRQDWRHLLPGMIEFFMLGSLCLLEAGGSNQLFPTHIAVGILGLYFFVGLAFNLTYSVITLRLLGQHRRLLPEVHSSLTGKQLGWIRTGIYSMMGFIFLFLLSDFFSSGLSVTTTYMFTTTINVVIIYYFAINGIRQLNFTMPVAGEVEDEARPQVQGKDQEIEQETPKTKAINSVYTDLLEHMDSARPYLNDQLTISDLARDLTMSERSLSRLINAESGSHFNNFINDYRVTAAKTLLQDSDKDKLTMEAIAFEAGFYSRATFYSAFKKSTGESPTSFRSGPNARV